jgi:hypothetical protein
MNKNCVNFKHLRRSVATTIPLFGIFISLTLKGYAEHSCQLPAPLMDSTQELRHLKSKKKVDCVNQNQEEVKGFILKSFNEQMSDVDMEREVFINTMLGMIPIDYNYKEELINLYTSQIGGYYDPKAERYVMPTWVPEVLQAPTAIHELTHALQDQYYDLDSFNDPKKFTVDQVLARAALVEGDAMAVMVDYQRKEIGQASIQKEVSVDSLVLQQSLSLMLIPQFKAAPYSIGYSMLFPYTSGLRFVHTVLKQGGWKAIDQAFIDPPKSTEEVLHPEKFDAPESDFREIKDEEAIALTNSSDAKVEFSTTLGEFTLGLMLGTHIPKDQATKAAAGWAGDRTLIVKKGSTRGVLLYTEWDSPEEAKEFYEAAQKFSDVLKEKNKSKITLRMISKTAASIMVRSCPEINCAFNAQICPKFGRSERENAQVYWSIPSIFE